MSNIGRVYNATNSVTVKCEHSCAYGNGILHPHWRIQIPPDYTSNLLKYDGDSLRERFFNNNPNLVGMTINWTYDDECNDTTRYFYLHLAWDENTDLGSRLNNSIVLCYVTTGTLQIVSLFISAIRIYPRDPDINRKTLLLYTCFICIH